MNSVVTQMYNVEKDILGEPQEYKGIKLYPLKLLGELKYKDLLYHLFCYPKDTIQDKMIIKMSYLKFMLVILSQTSNDLQGFGKKDELEDFLKHITKTDKIQILYSIKSLDNIENIKFTIKIKDVEFSEYDFDNLREIILQQNGSSIEYVNQYDAKLEEEMQFMSSWHTDMTFEENIFTFCAMSGISINQLKDYTLYQFKKHATRLSLWKNYETFKPIEITNPGKNGEEWVKNYLTHIDDNKRYASILIPRKEFEKSGIFDKSSGFIAK